ncbi:MAG: hypothetical protein KGQ38_01605 [Actinomycetales bacterium]|nr:hypothetical protein [Actinomycetales bacterium]
MRKLAALCGLIEAISLLTFGAFVLINESEQNGVRGTSPHPGILFAIYVVFAVAVFGITYALAKFRDWARTPFGLIQIFALLVFAYLPLSGTGRLAHISGALVAVVAVTALIALWRMCAEVGLKSDSNLAD